jgi:Holliday junction resolvasome RuvABC ATP-dependent DNA helicase subunit
MKGIKMFIRKDFKYEPNQIGDIIWGNAEGRMRIEDIVSGTEALPYCGKSAILLYGVFGTGKTTLAKILPQAIEM